MSDQIADTAAKFFEPKLHALRLSVKQIEEQNLAELQDSLERVNDAISNPDSFGVLKLKMTAQAGAIVVTAHTESHIEVGILPTLLERKALVIERIKELRPKEQIQDFRQEVIEKVKDLSTREQLLKVLAEHEQMEKELSSRIEKESSQLSSEASTLTLTSSVAKLEARYELLEKTVTKLDGAGVDKFDVVGIVFVTLAAVAGLTGAVLGIIKWLAG